MKYYERLIQCNNKNLEVMQNKNKKSIFNTIIKAI